METTHGTPELVWRRKKGGVVGGWTMDLQVWQLSWMIFFHQSQMVAEEKFFNTRDKEFLNCKWDMFLGKGRWHVYLHLKFVSKMSHLKSVCFKTIEQWRKRYGCLGYIIGIELPCSLRLRIIFDHVSLLNRPAIHGKDSLKGCKANIWNQKFSTLHSPPIFEEWSIRWQLEVFFLLRSSCGRTVALVFDPWFY